MSQQEVDEYLANLEEPKRTTLQELRQTIRHIVPEAEEGISYGMPAYRLRGKVIAGFAAFKTTSATCRTVVPHLPRYLMTSPAT